MSLNIVIGIATAGRPSILPETLRDIERQTRAPERIIVCAPAEADFGMAREQAGASTSFLIGPRGLTRQRNAIITAAGDADAVLFLDDDFLMAPDYVSMIDKAMSDDPSIVVATGLVLADGIKGPGLGFGEGLAILARATTPAAPAIRPVFTGYGCNMAIRLAPMRQHALAFDEALPLYGWQEDVDLSRQLSPFGRIVQVDAARGVHLGTKSGRNSGVRLGYSQIANPLYLAARKRGYPIGRAVEHAARNMAANLVRSLRPEPYVDRRGRLRGNLHALRDLLRGRMTPGKVLDL